MQVVHVRLKEPFVKQLLCAASIVQVVVIVSITHTRIPPDVKLIVNSLVCLLLVSKTECFRAVATLVRIFCGKSWT